ncbi:hypothetical protein Bbelb_349960 [Branchiostoma belcheri]|nr:hypothetical protein Bbelb_349960 [Branchiostoma belcheri]
MPKIKSTEDAGEFWRRKSEELPAKLSQGVPDGPGNKCCYYSVTGECVRPCSDCHPNGRGPVDNSCTQSLSLISFFTVWFTLNRPLHVTDAVWDMFPETTNHRNRVMTYGYLKARYPNLALSIHAIDQDSTAKMEKAMREIGISSFYIRNEATREGPSTFKWKTVRSVVLLGGLPARCTRGGQCAKLHPRTVCGKDSATSCEGILCEREMARPWCMVGENAGPAQWPDTSRLVEAICLQLCADHPSATRTAAGETVQRWSVIMKEYCHFRQLVLSGDLMMSQTTQLLFDIIARTLSQWHGFQDPILDCLFIVVETDNHIHYGNRTNNRVEGNHGKLKKRLEGKVTMSQLIGNMLLFSDAKAAQTSFHHNDMFFKIFGGRSTRLRFRRNRCSFRLGPVNLYEESERLPGKTSGPKLAKKNGRARTWRRRENSRDPIGYFAPTIEELWRKIEEKSNGELNPSLFGGNTHTKR